jgi:hypothetical protein
MAKFNYEPVREREAHISDPLKTRWQNGVNTKVCAFFVAFVVLSLAHARARAPSCCR